MRSSPFFTIITPTHKRAKLLRRALESIKSQACSVPVEVILVSDCTDPETDAVAAEMLSIEDTYVRRSGASGPSASRNLALTLAKGQYVIFLDDDDALYPGFLEQLHVQAPVKMGFPVFFNCTVVTERRLPEGPELLSEVGLNLGEVVSDAIYVKNQAPISCFAYPRSLLQGMSFDCHMRAYEDWEFLLAIYDRASPVHLALIGCRIFQVLDETTDRRGSSRGATDFNAVLDYVYVYRRHPAPNVELAHQRAALLASVGMSIDPQLL